MAASAAAKAVVNNNNHITLITMLHCILVLTAMTW